MGFKILAPVVGERTARDRNGWPVRTGARVRRYTKDGMLLKQKWMVESVDFTDPKYPEGLVALTGLKGGGEGLSVPGRLEVIRTAPAPHKGEDDKRPMDVQRYHNIRRDEELVAGLEQRQKDERDVNRKARKKARRVKRKVL